MVSLRLGRLDALEWKSSGRGAAWLARLLGVQEVPGSNPGGPTKRIKKIEPRNGATLCVCDALCDVTPIESWLHRSLVASAEG